MSIVLTLASISLRISRTRSNGCPLGLGNPQSSAGMNGAGQHSLIEHSIVNILILFRYETGFVPGVNGGAGPIFDWRA